MLMWGTVNELSNSMELIPLLTRAESLFRRFERTVQAIDKKNNFPSAPTAHRRKPSQTDKGKSRAPEGSSTGVSAGASTSTQPGDSEDAEAKVISPELRILLRRDIPWRRQVRVEEKKPA